MTKQSKSIGAKAFATIFVSFLFVTASLCASAQSAELVDSSKNMHIKYIGTDDDMMLISVAYRNTDKSEFNLAIYNGLGELLFRDRFKGQNFDRKFKVPKEHGKLNLVIAGAGTNVSRSFDAYSMSKEIDNPLVTK